MTEKNRIVIYLDEENTKKLKEIANKESRSTSNLIGFIVKQYLDQVQKNEEESN